MHLKEVFCLFCCQSLARIGLDKKQRPCLHCAGCGARAFLPRYECLTGLAILPTLHEAWAETVSEDDRRTQLAIFLADLKERAQRAPARPEPMPNTPEGRKAGVEAIGDALKELTK